MRCSIFARALALFGFLSVAACGSNEVDPCLVGEKGDVAGVVFVIEAEGPEGERLSKSQFEAAVERLKIRAERWGWAEVCVRPEPDHRLRVTATGEVEAGQLRAALGLGRHVLGLHRVLSDDPDDIYTKFGLATPAEGRLVRTSNPDQRHLIIADAPALSGERVESARAAYSEFDGSPQVAVTLTAEGGKAFAALTREMIGERLAVVVNDRVVTAPVVRSAIRGGGMVITGGFTLSEAIELAASIENGALGLSFTLIEERHVAPAR